MLDLQLLRTFVLLVDSGSVSRVADIVGRTQPAISLQLRRLEGAAGCALFEGSLRHPVLSQKGEVLLAHARKLLELHDTAQAHLAVETVEGVVKLGCPDLYAGYFLPSILDGFSNNFPNVDLNIRCALSVKLTDEVKAGALDLAIATHTPETRRNLGVRAGLGFEQLAWFGAAGGQARHRRPLALAMLPAGNLYRDLALDALAQRRISTRIVSESESVSGLHSVTRADIAVTVLPAKTDLAGIERIDLDGDLPQLPTVELFLFNRNPGASKAVDGLAEHILKRRSSGPR